MSLAGKRGRLASVDSALGCRAMGDIFRLNDDDRVDPIGLRQKSFAMLKMSSALTSAHLHSMTSYIVVHVPKSYPMKRLSLLNSVRDQ